MRPVISGCTAKPAIQALGSSKTETHQNIRFRLYLLKWSVYHMH